MSSTAMSSPTVRHADLHLHSIASDGTLAPAAVVDLVASRGISIFSLTDHDSVEGQAEAAARAAESGLECVPGVELSVGHEGQDLHILGYFIDPSNGPLRSHLSELRSGRESRLSEMLCRLAAEGVVLSEEEVRAVAEPGAALGRMHVARALVATGKVRGVNDAFRLYLADGGLAHVQKETATPEAAFSLLREAGAAPCLAHPGAYRKVEGLLERLVPLGLVGLEVVHPMHTPDDSKRFGEMATRWGLLSTGGSDYHGGRDHDFLPGAHWVDGEIVARLAERRRSEAGARRFFSRGFFAGSFFSRGGGRPGSYGAE